MLDKLSGSSSWYGVEEKNRMCAPLLPLSPEIDFRAERKRRIA